MSDQRPSWDFIWMSMAHMIASRSVDERCKVGALIVTDDNTQILALGYNGDQRGGSNKPDSFEPGKSGFIHAEVNCLIRCDFNNPKRKKLYCSVLPCPLCSRCLVNGNIDEVIYDSPYRDQSGLSILEAAGVKVRRFSLT